MSSDSSARGERYVRSLAGVRRRQPTAALSGPLNSQGRNVAASQSSLMGVGDWTQASIGPSASQQVSSWPYATYLPATHVYSSFATFDYATETPVLESSGPSRTESRYDRVRQPAAAQTRRNAAASRYSVVGNTTTPPSATRSAIHTWLADEDDSLGYRLLFGGSGNGGGASGFSGGPGIDAGGTVVIQEDHPVVDDLVTNATRQAKTLTERKLASDRSNTDAISARNVQKKASSRQDLNSEKASSSSAHVCVHPGCTSRFGSSSALK